MEIERGTRRWLQFSLRTFLIAVLVVAAFLAGRASSIRRAHQAEKRQVELEEQVARLAGFNLYTDEFAVELKASLEALKPLDIPGSKTERIALVKSMNVDLDRLPRMKFSPSEGCCPEGYFLSPRHYLVIYDCERRIEVSDQTSSRSSVIEWLMQAR